MSRNKKIYILVVITLIITVAALVHLFYNSFVFYKEYNNEPHKWLKFPKLIAHAGGSYRRDQEVLDGTNSLEAIIQNYNLGHRVFEIDLNLTSDNDLAAVHDWYAYNNGTGKPMSSKEWKEQKEKLKYTTILISDVLEQMIINKDMFIVTDTKSFELTEEQTKLQFQLIYEKAMEKDPELLDRIIPQIYNEEMYDIITSVYKFKNIIYTAYATKDSLEEIISFASQKDEIKVITVPFYDPELNQKNIRDLHSKKLKIYVHTINKQSEINQFLLKGIDGFYTDCIIP